MLRTLSMNPPQNAGHRPRTSKPGTKNEANFSMNALISSQKSPKVTIVRGNVRIFKRMPIVPLTRPMTTAAINAVPNPWMKNPGTKFATSSRHRALNIQCANNFTT